MSVAQRTLAVRRQISAGAVGAYLADHIVAIVATAALLLLIGAPLVVMVAGSFRSPADYLPSEAGAFWSLRNYTDVYTSSAFRATLRDTVVYAAGSVALALVIGVTVAWLVGRTDLPFRSAIFILMLFPIMIPPVIGTISWLLLLNPGHGYINELLRVVLPWTHEPGPINPFSMGGMIVVQGMGLAGIVYLLTVTSIMNLDPSLEEASRASGAGFWTTLRRVTLPLLRPALLATTILATIFAIEGFDVPLLLGVGARVHVISLEMYKRLNTSSGLPLWGNVLALAVFYVVIAYLMFIAYHRLTARAERYATISGKGFRPRPLALGRWRWPALLPVAFYLALEVFFPVFILIWTSLHQTYVPVSVETVRSMTVDSYRQLFHNTVLWPSVWHTVAVAAGSATLITIVTALTAWTVVRSRTSLKLGLDLLASSSVGIPAVLAGVSFLIFYLTVPNPIYGTLWLLVITFSYRTAFSYRLHRSTMTQIGRELEEASVVSGAPPLQTLRRVVLPLLAPGMVITWLLLFIIGTREFTLPMLLGQRAMLGPLLYDLLDRLGQATALATLTIVAIAAGGFLAYRYVLRAVRPF